MQATHERLEDRQMKSKLKRRSIAIDDDLWSKIIAMATANDRSTSQYVRLILRAHMRNIGIKLKSEEEE